MRDLERELRSTLARMAYEAPQASSLPAPVRRRALARRALTAGVTAAIVTILGIAAFRYTGTLTQGASTNPAGTARETCAGSPAPAKSPRTAGYSGLGPRARRWSSARATSRDTGGGTRPDSGAVRPCAHRFASGAQARRGAARSGSPTTVTESSFTEAPDVLVLFGVASRRTNEVAIEFDRGGQVTAYMVPDVKELPYRFFITFPEPDPGRSLRGEVVARDVNGHVLEKRRLCSPKSLRAGGGDTCGR
jgi:hypothetical protein